MSWKRKVTIVLMVACTALIVIWDLFVAIDSSGIAERGQTTVSGITLGWAQHHPALPFGLGGLVGHLLWPLKAASNRLVRAIVLVGMALTWVIVDIWVDFSIHAMMIFLPSVGLGHLLWPQVDTTEESPKTES